MRREVLFGAAVATLINAIVFRDVAELFAIPSGGAAFGECTLIGYVLSFADPPTHPRCAHSRINGDCEALVAKSNDHLAQLYGSRRRRRLTAAIQSLRSRGVHVWSVERMAGGHALTAVVNESHRERTICIAGRILQSNGERDRYKSARTKDV
jgi:hypothetical protein